MKRLFGFCLKTKKAAGSSELQRTQLPSPSALLLRRRPRPLIPPHKSIIDGGQQSRPPSTGGPPSCGDPPVRCWIGFIVCWSEMDEVAPALATGQASTESVTEQPLKVYIWDMDETLILLKSLLDGSYAGAFDGLKDREKSVEIGKRWENLILELCDEHFFYEEIENYNEPYLNALSEYDDGRDLTSYDFEADCFSSPYDDVNKKKLAYRHRAIGEKYAKGLENLFDQHMVKVWNDLYNLTDKYTDGWLSSAHKLLEVALGTSAVAPTTNSSSINCIVTSGSLIPSLAKCLLYRLNDVVSSENVYSSWEVGKLQCFKWIKERFDGPNVRFCAIGDGHEECSAAQVMKWPFIKIEFHPDAPHRFPGLDMPTVQTYMDVIYESSSKDG